MAARMETTLATTGPMVTGASDARSDRMSDRELDAIVVLGCPVGADGRASASLARRAALGAHLFASGRAPRVVFSGGITRAGRVSEAAAAAVVARVLGLSSDVIALEERSLTTEENARFASELLGRSARIVIATDDYHVRRARWIFAPHFAHVEGEGAHGPFDARVRGALRELPLLPLYAAKLAIARRLGRP